MSGGADDLAALYRRLLAESELNGRVSARSLPPAPGSDDGFVLESLLVTIPPEDDVDPLLSAVAAWFTHASARAATICLSRPGGASVELSPASFEGLTPGEQRSQFDQLAKLLRET